MASATYAGATYAGAPYTGAGPVLPAAATEEIEFLLYDEVNANFLGKLDNSWGRRWSDPLNDAGGGEVSVASDSPLALGQLVDGSGRAKYHDIVRCRLNGADRFAWIVAENTKGTAKAGEEVEDVLRLSGPGTLAYFQRALVYPERGVGRLSPDDRLFDWTSQDYDDTAWVAAKEVKQQFTTVAGSLWNAMPKGWPNGFAFWIWGASGQPNLSVPGGDAYFRKTFTLANAATAVVAFTADDGADVYLDNARIAEKQIDKGQSWPTIARVDLNLDAGPHLFAVKASNIPPAQLPPGALNTAGLLFTVHVNAYGTGAGLTDFGSLILQSDSSWKVLEYPPGGPPGMTTGQILRLLFTEAQARGALPGVTWSFTDALDSAGQPWTVIPDFGVSVGTTYYAVLRMLAEIACDFRMHPSSLRLDVFNQRGSASGVTLAVASNVTDLEHQGTGDLANAALMRHKDGWREVISSSSIATGGRYESFLSLGTAPSVEQGTLAAQALFVAKANPQDAFVVTHEGRVGSGEEPYLNYDVGDTVSVSRRDLSLASEAVQAITVSEDDEGHPVYTPELQALSEVLESRLQRWLKRMAMGTHAGQSENASPYVSQGGAQDKVPIPVAGTGLRYATVVVAAANSSHAAQADADFVCTGANDEVTINSAIAALSVSASSFAVSGGRVLLMDGTYQIGGQIGPASGNNRTICLQGQGWSTRLNVTANISGDVIKLGLDGEAEVRDLRIVGNGHTVTYAVEAFGGADTDLASLSHLLISGFVFTNAGVYVDGGRCFDVRVSGTGVGFQPNADLALIQCAAVMVSGAAVDCAQSAKTFVLGGDYSSTFADTFKTVRDEFTMLGARVASQNGSALFLESCFNVVVAGNFLVASGASTPNHVIRAEDGTARTLITSNHIRQLGGSSVDGINVAGDQNAVIGNFIEGNSTARTGIRIESTADRTAAVGNVIAHCSAAINNLGTNTQLAYTGGATGDNLAF